MIRNLLAVSLVTFVVAQYPGARNNVNPADNIPAWYQMSKPAQAPPAYPYERREQYERMERPQTNTFAGYPTFSNPRTAYPTESVAPHPQTPVRRYQGNTDNPWGAVPKSGPHTLSVERYHKLLLLKKLAQRKTTITAAPTTTSTTEGPEVPEVPETEEVESVTSEKTVSPYEKPPLSLEKIYSTIKPVPITSKVSTTQEPVKNTGKTSAMKTFKLKFKKVTVKPKNTASTAGSTVDSWMTPQIETELPTLVTEEPVLSTRPEKIVTEVPTTEANIPSTSQETTQQLIQETQTAEVPSTTSRKPPAPFGGDQIGQRFICRHKTSEEHELHTKRTLAPFRRVDRTFKPRGLRPAASTSTVLPESYKIGSGVVNNNNWELKQKSLFEYLWPNTELIAAIKDVMAKFKASLDETGLDQDVRLMGNQLKNTWQQLRTGVDRGVRAVKQSAEYSVKDFGHNNNYNYIEDMSPMNEQIGRLFEKAAADAIKEKEDKKQ